ncbi:hypothetical protein J433_03910 [Corynebacterium glutamicum MT]|uniref:HNH endonuclease n=1 Tax=Corynebacterium glutamicum TaxID=1718 RepID=A0AB36IJ55_CORGT|nr:HNH endonuclease signature motif containing protein [Corynebacterium glutamicum]AGN20389.1 hypothetical protein C624_14110 [Corynebacterium glutamicum SCgG1]AGN23413.1 hypothetical protein C629_14115 [Corynebacterium glutamicum SCgG2]EGV39612.1 hypothetical protein CgS9114_12492 [Corynebacterium glutamicum S9114]EOA65404.1 hypothetical protein J433_03910 [Corynebacterium glutamicum MT]EPP39470.1 hypothetical protein A583_13638 [Corynebacterium glutamicum Z188]
MQEIHTIIKHMDALIADPSAAAFKATLPFAELLEKLHNKKALFDAALAKSAERADAGRIIGKTSHIDALAYLLDISKSEAFRRTKRAEEHYGNPSPEPSSEELAKETPEEKLAREEKEKQDLAEQAEANRIAREHGISAEKQDTIRYELEKLNDNTSLSRASLRKLAMQEATSRTPEDLRNWTRNKVIRINPTAKDPLAAVKKRSLSIGRQDHDGGAKASLYLDAKGLALLKSLMSKAKPGHLLEDSLAEDKRTKPQRQYDAFADILHRAHSDLLPARSGVGTILVSLSAKDVANLKASGPDHRYPTSTGIKLTPLEILRLGAAKYDFVTVLDSESGRPLHLARTQRTASLYQRLALFASELVCTREGCDSPFEDNEIHHIRSWLDGGPTDIENITNICPHDHGNNNDQRDGKDNMGHMNIDPTTGRVGYQPADRRKPMRFNNTAAAAESGGAQART